VIEVRVTQNGSTILRRVFGSEVTMELALKQTEMYIVNEQLNVADKCMVGVKYSKNEDEDWNLKGSFYPWEIAENNYSNNIIKFN
jgi:hypothetical protein